MLYYVRRLQGGHTHRLMAPGHTLSVVCPRPHTLLDMLPDHIVSVDGPRPHTLVDLYAPQTEHFK